MPISTKPSNAVKADAGEITKTLRWLARETEFVFAAEQLNAAAALIESMQAQLAETKRRLDAAIKDLREKAERSRANSFSVQTDMFGEYCLVPTGCDKEKHIYKVVTRFRSNSYCEVPLVHDSKPVLHDGVVDVLNVIHCGIDETKVERVALSDVELCGKRLEAQHEQN